jgi:plasmid maintenance system antidote protein VapI
MSKSTKFPRRQTGSGGTGLYGNVCRKMLAQEVGVTPETISRIFNGHQGCRGTILVAIAHALGISIERLSADLQAAQSRRGTV